MILEVKYKVEQLSNVGFMSMWQEIIEPTTRYEEALKTIKFGVKNYPKSKFRLIKVTTEIVDIPSITD